MGRKYKCKHCGEYSEESIKLPVGRFCCFEHATEWAQRKREREFMRKLNKETKEKEKADRAKHRERKKEVRPLKEWQDKLQRLVNQYVVHVRDKGKPCCTCGTDSPDIKYDAGHYRTRKAAPELRYELTNIHVQCSVQCNQHGSGMRSEYRDFIKANYGQKHLDWLDGPHQSLKEKFPHWTDYENEINRYRKLLRDNGITPCA